MGTKTDSLAFKYVLVGYWNFEDMYMWPNTLYACSSIRHGFMAAHLQNFSF